MKEIFELQKEGQYEKEPEKLSILEIGPGYRPLLKERDINEETMRYLTVELDVHILKESPSAETQKEIFINAAAEMLPFKPQSIDAIISANFISGGRRNIQEIYHYRGLKIPERRAGSTPGGITMFLNETKRILKNNGVIVDVETNTPLVLDFILFASRHFNIRDLVMPAIILKNEKNRMEQEIKEIIERHIDDVLHSGSIPLIDQINRLQRAKGDEKDNELEELENWKRANEHLYDILPLISNNFIEVETANLSRRDREQIFINFTEKRCKQLSEGQNEIIQKVLKSCFERLSDDAGSRAGIVTNGDEIISRGGDCLPYLAVFNNSEPEKKTG